MQYIDMEIHALNPAVAPSLGKGEEGMEVVL